MHIAAILPAAAGLTNILISNDDGWAELNIRTLYDAVLGAGYHAIISAPAVNKSGRGSLDGDPTQLDDDGCEFASCPPFSPPTGLNVSQPEFNYVNSYPVTSVKLGIKQTSSKFFDGPPDLVLSGVNVGCNLDIAVLGSGTVGAACEAVNEGIPAIALSGCTGTQVSWESIDPGYSALYAELGVALASVVIKAGKPYLPPNIWLNVNFPETSNVQCSSVGDFSFVMSRIVPAVPFITDKDIDICDNNGRLPAERSVVNTAGCYASVSVGFADTKHTADAAHQQLVYDRIKHILTCLPEPGNSIDL